MDERTRQRQFEDQFLGQLRARAQGLVRGGLRSDRLVVESTPEGVDEARDTLRRLEVFDRDALDGLGGTGALQLRFERGRLGGLLRTTVARLRARVLAPVEAIVTGQSPEPVGRERVLTALARYQLLPRRQQPSGVVFASATGFTPEARRLVDAPGPPTLVLVGQRPDGGWDVYMSDATRRSPWARLFEFESADDRVRRVLYHLDQQADLLDSRGVALPALAERLGLGRAETEGLLRRALRTQPRLMTVVHNGTLHVCRSPLANEGDSMSIWSRIRRLLRMKPTVAERVREMTAQRVRLEQQRHELDQRIARIEEEERAALEQGAAAGSDALRRQAAGRLMRLRRDLGRLRSQANIFTQQIDILGTHLHHLTLAEQGRRMELPRAEELTREAAQAETLMGELAANADLARSIEVTGETPMMAEEELAIMDELRQLAASKAGPAPSAEGQAGRAAAQADAARSAAPKSGVAPVAGGSAAPAPPAAARDPAARAPGTEKAGPARPETG